MLASKFVSSKKCLTPPTGGPSSHMSTRPEVPTGTLTQPLCPPQESEWSDLARRTCTHTYTHTPAAGWSLPPLPPLPGPLATTAPVWV